MTIKALWLITDCVPTNRPRPLELTASDEVVATENLDVLRKNGFEVEIKGGDVLLGSSRLMLTAQPVSKSTIFDMKGRMLDMLFIFPLTVAINQILKSSFT